MGGLQTKSDSQTKPKKNILTNSEILEFRNISSFSEQIIVKLHNHYSLFCAVHSDDGVIDYSEFCYLINKTDNTLSRRIFNAIDTNNDHVINFIEFIKFFGCFNYGTLEEKVVLSFKIFSVVESKSIKSDTMYDIISEIVKSERKIKSYFDKDTIKLIIDNTFNNIVSKKVDTTKDERPFNSVLSKFSNNSKIDQEADRPFKSLGSKNNLEKVENPFKSSSKSNRNVVNTEESEGKISILKKMEDKIIENTPNDRHDTINFKQYKELIIDNPAILNWLKLDLEHIKNAKISNTQVKKSKSYCYY